MSQEKLPEPGRIRLVLDDGSTVEVPADTISLYGNVEVRRKAREVVEPLAAPGVDSVEFREEDERPTVSVEASELPAYDVPETEGIPLGETVRPMVVTIAAVAFLEGNKWRLSEGQHTFYAAMEDEDFLARVEHGSVAFRKGDMLRCQMRITQSQKAGALHTEYAVVAVEEHIPRDVQLRLDGGEG